MSENPFEGMPPGFAAMIAKAQEAEAHNDIQARAVQAEIDELLLALTPRQLYLVGAMVHAAAGNADNGFFLSGRINSVLQFVHKVDPYSGHPFGHEVFGGEG